MENGASLGFSGATKRDGSLFVIECREGILCSHGNSVFAVGIAKDIGDGSAAPLGVFDACRLLVSN